MPPKVRAVAVALALAVAGCSGDDDDAGDDDAETSSSTAVKAEVALEVTRAELVSPHQARGPLDAATRDAVGEVVERLLLVTSAQPLASGRAGAGFADLFTPSAGARAAGADRAALFDEGVPSFGELETETATVELIGLAGSMDPATALVIAKFTWAVASGERPGDRIARAGQLSLVPDDGGWVIGAYTVAVTRTIDDTTTTTTAEER